MYISDDQRQSDKGGVLEKGPWAHLAPSQYFSVSQLLAVSTACPQVAAYPRLGIGVITLPGAV